MSQCENKMLLEISYQIKLKQFTIYIYHFQLVLSVFVKMRDITLKMCVHFPNALGITTVLPIINCN